MNLRNYQKRNNVIIPIGYVLQTLDGRTLRTITISDKDQDYPVTASVSPYMMDKDGKIIAPDRDCWTIDGKWMKGMDTKYDLIIKAVE